MRQHILEQFSKIPIHRTKEEIDLEKELKHLRAEAKLKKEAEKKARIIQGEAYIAKLKEVEDTTIANADREFPRHKLESKKCWHINLLYGQ
jgi:uncharacterized protein YhbP (UPF0306 family)